MGAVTRHFIAIDDICPDANQFFVLIQKTQSIAVMQGFIRQQLHLNGIAPLHLTDVFTHRFWGEWRTDIRLTAMDEIIGKATVERLLGVDFEIVGAMSQ